MTSSSRKLDYNKARYYERKAQGLCPCCSNPVSSPEFIFCNEHLALIKQKHKDSCKQRRLALIAKNLCGQCGKHIIAIKRSKTLCSICLDEAKLKWRETKDTLKYRDVRASYARTHRDRVRLEVFEAYGGATCKCCGEDEIRFLEMDHINNDGNIHRRSMKSGYIYYWLKRNKFPTGFQILCANCNMGKHRCGGVCPHKLCQ